MVIQSSSPGVFPVEMNTMTGSSTFPDIGMLSNSIIEMERDYSMT